MECSRIEHPDNGRVIVGSYEVGGIARFQCREGYEIKGHSQAICLISGEFDPSEPPECERKYNSYVFIAYMLEKFPLEHISIIELSRQTTILLTALFTNLIQKR